MAFTLKGDEEGDTLSKYVTETPRGGPQNVERGRLTGMTVLAIHECEQHMANRWTPQTRRGGC